MHKTAPKWQMYQSSQLFLCFCPKKGKSKPTAAIVMSGVIGCVLVMVPLQRLNWRPNPNLQKCNPKFQFCGEKKSAGRFATIAVFFTSLLKFLLQPKKFIAMPEENILWPQQTCVQSTKRPTLHWYPCVPTKQPCVLQVAFVLKFYLLPELQFVPANHLLPWQQNSESCFHMLVTCVASIKSFLNQTLLGSVHFNFFARNQLQNPRRARWGNTHWTTLPLWLNL